MRERERDLKKCLTLENVSYNVFICLKQNRISGALRLIQKAKQKANIKEKKMLKKNSFFNNFF